MVRLSGEGQRGAKLHGYAVSGSEEYALRELLLVRFAVTLFRLLPSPRITRDQLLMLLAGKTVDPVAAVAAFGLQLTQLPERLPEILATAWTSW